MPDVKIFAGRNCGWAVRNYVALMEKDVPFETVSPTDSSGRKSDEFLRATPYAMTPVLIHGDAAVFESTLINEYIDDRFPDPPLMPPNPADRSEVRKWIHYCEKSLLRPLIRGAADQSMQDRSTAIEIFRERANWFARNVLPENRSGPYFFGAQFTLLDIAFHTLFKTVRQIEESHDEVFGILHESLKEWQSSIDSRPSTRKAIDYWHRIPH